MFVSAFGRTGESFSGRGSIDEDVPKKTQGEAVLPLQRHSGLWEHSHQQKEIQQATHHSFRRG